MSPKLIARTAAARSTEAAWMSKWRDTYKVYPGSDCFPVMSEDELDALAVEDPADPRGVSEDEGVKIIRHRAWEYMSDVEPPVEVTGGRHKALEQGYRLRRSGPTRTRFTLIDKTKTRIRIGDEIVLTLEKIEAWLDRDRRPM